MEKRLRSVKVSDKFFKEIKESMQVLLNIEFDKVMLDILAYVIVNEPASLYRATRESPYSISLVYKKAKKMVNLGLIKAVSSSANYDRRSKRLYASTVKGLFVCLSFNCAGKRTFITRLSEKWNLKTNEDLYKLLPVFRILPYVITQNDVTVLENPSLLMLNIVEGNQYEGMNAVNVREAQRSAMRCLVGEILNRVINGDKTIKQAEVCADDSTLLIGIKNGLVRFDPENKSIFVFSCEMCKKGCCMVKIPLNDKSCKLLLDLRSKIELIPSFFSG